MAKRANGEGNIRKRKDGKWLVTFPTGLYKDNGKREYVYKYATRCFEAGVDIKAISEQLGHANVKTTYNIYVHLLEDTKEKEIDKLGKIDKLLA